MNTREILFRSRRALAACVAIGLCSSFGAAHASPGSASRMDDNLPPVVRITCPTPSPLTVFVSLPALRVHWVGRDPDGSGGLPTEYKYILLGPASEFPVSQALTDPDSLRRYYALHPLGPWAGWNSTGSGNPSAALTNLIPNEHYLFVVVAFDQAGDYSRVFSLSTNLLNFVTSYAGYQGPVITLSGPGLDYRYPAGGYCPCPSAEVPVEIPERRPATFGWFAEAITACDNERVARYRWALDIADVFDETPRVDEQTDLRHWSTRSGGTTATLPPFALASPPTPDVHFLYIEAEDLLGFRSLGIVRITVAPATNRAPDCRAATANPRILWPPNRRFVPVQIMGVSDPDGDPVTIEVTGVTQDEPISNRNPGGHAAMPEPVVEDAGDVATAEHMQYPEDEDPDAERGDGRRGCADAILGPDGGLRLRAERDGRSDGRVYTIGFTARDGHGGTCDGSVRVCVPRDRLRAACVDDGQIFNSLGPCRERHLDDARRAKLEVVSDAIRSNDAATLEYSLPTASEVLIAVYDVTGRRVTTLENEYQAAGPHRTTWDHASVPQGMYFVRMLSGPASMTRSKLIVR